MRGLVMLIGTACQWLLLWLVLVAAICWAGAVSGGLLFPVAGLLLKMDLPVGEMVRNGLLDGGFLALIWAPGLSFVGCLIWAHAGRRPDRAKAANPLDRSD